MIDERHGFRGYVFSRAINGSTIPQRVQNLTIRSYAQNRGMLYLLSATEYGMEGCYMMLHATLQELDRVEGIVFYSLRMLPPEASARQRLYRRIIDTDSELHFALEELRIKTPADAAAIEEIIACSQIAGPPLIL